MQTKNIDFIDLSLYLKKQKTLVFSDFHLGYEEAMQRKGVLVPRFQSKDTQERIKSIFKICDTKKYTLDKIIVNGDIKHEFGKISDQEWREILKLIDLLVHHCKKLILIKGNHDVMLSPIIKKKKELGEENKIESKEYYIQGDIFFCHGDLLPESFLTKEQLKKINMIIIGNEHPAIALQDKSRVERFKCFLEGNYKRKKLIVLPSFQLLTTGTDMLHEKRLSPYLQKNIDEFKVWIISDKKEVLDFGKLKKIKNL